MYDIFISHSSKDRYVAEKVCAALEERGVKFWIALRDSKGIFAKTIIDAINDAKGLVLIFSSNSNDSDHVLREITAASSRRKPIVVFRIGDELPTGGLEYFTGPLHWVDGFPPPVDKHLGKLVDAVIEEFGLQVEERHREAEPPGFAERTAVKPKSQLRNPLYVIPIVLIIVAALVIGNLFRHPKELDVDKLLNTIAGNIESAGESVGPKYELIATTEKPTYSPGEDLDFKLSVDDDCYLYLANIFYNGEVVLLFPNGIIPDNFIEAKKNLTMSDITGGFSLEITPESEGGTEFIMVIASPIELPLLELLEQGLSSENVFGSFGEQYGLQDALAMINKAIQEGCEPLREINEDGTLTGGDAPGAVSDRSLAVEIVKYSVAANDTL